jgi:protein transport protein SEC20
MYSARTNFRRAQVQSKRNAATARAQERDLLFAAKSTDLLSDTPPRRRNTAGPKSAEDEAVAASRDVTAGLLRTKQLLETEVQRSYFSQEAYEESKEALKGLSETYSGLDSLLANSRSLLGTLVKSQKSDTWYLETTFYILVATISWLVFRRFIYGPFWWFAWFPLKLVYRLVFTVLGVFGLTGGASNSLASPSVVQSSTTAIPPVSMSGEPVGRGMDAEFPAKVTDPSPDGSLSQEIGKMAEKSQNADKEPIVRGDGTVLESSEQKRYPKKRMFDTEAEQKKQDAKLAEQQAKKDKDEL